MTVTPEEFVRVFQSAASRKEVAEKCEVTVEAVDKRARYYRSKGVCLKCFRPRPAWLELRALAKVSQRNDKRGKR